MAKTETVKARIEPELKLEGEAVLAAIGLNTTEAITMFFRQIVMHKGLPFEAKIPNAETVKVLKDAEKGKGLSESMSFEDYQAEVTQMANEIRQGK